MIFGLIRRALRRQVRGMSSGRSFCPSTIRDTLGMAGDSTMLPWPCFAGRYLPYAAAGERGVMNAVICGSFYLDQLEEGDCYTIHLYGAVQDGYLERWAAAEEESKLIERLFLRSLI